MNALSLILKKMYENYAIVFPGISALEAQRSSIALVKMGLPRIPSGYVTFLEATNGLSWNGLTLFSLNQIERNRGTFFHTGIMQYAPKNLGNPFLRKKLILGMAPEEFIVYAAAEAEYQILDRYTFQPVLKYARFMDVLHYYAQKLIKAPES